MNAMQQLLTEHMAIWTAADTEKKSGRGRASGNAGSVYGIKKLRELILELAVRGKLVPQEANDEPASELLKRIQAEKAKLVAESKIKKDKPLVPITDDEKPFELPHGWEWVHLPDVTEYKVGKTPSTKSSVYWTTDNTGYNWVSIADLNHDDVVTETTKKVTHQALKEVFKTDPVPAGTILMSFKLTLGKVSILHMPAFHNEAIISIYPSSAIDKKYLFKILPARANEGDSKSAIKGNTLNSESIAALLLPLPPIAEQHRIVAKVDELMTLCDQLEAQHSNAAEAHEKLVGHLLGTLTQSQSADDFSFNWQRIAAHFDVLFTTEASIDALKQTLLQLAVMGKLVSQDPNDEPASELLKRIQTEKAKLIAEGKLKKEKLLSPISTNENLFDLPKGWEWSKILDCSIFVTDGEHATPQRTSDGLVPLVTAKNVRDGYMDYDDTDFVDILVAEKCWKRCKPVQNDLLMVSVGATLGRLTILDESKDMVIVRSVTLIRPCLLSPLYLSLAIKSPLVQQAIWNSVRQMAQPGLYLAQSSNLVIPLPPLPEQYRIVAKVDALMTLCDQLKTRIIETNLLQQKLADVMVENCIA